MEFPNGQAFTKVYGAGLSSRELAHYLGIATTSAVRLAKECGVALRYEPLRIPGLQHLPGLPDFATSRTWAGGTWYRIDCERAGDSPGYRSLLIHLSKQAGDDLPDDLETSECSA